MINTILFKDIFSYISHKEKSEIERGGGIFPSTKVLIINFCYVICVCRDILYICTKTNFPLIKIVKSFVKCATKISVILRKLHLATSILHIIIIIMIIMNKYGISFKTSSAHDIPDFLSLLKTFKSFSCYTKPDLLTAVTIHTYNSDK